MDEVTRDALDRLLEIARSDTGQSRRAANFILAWWNAESLGGFDIAELFAVDAAIGKDMARIFNFLATRTEAVYPEGREEAIQELIRIWRPEVWAKAQQS